MHAQLLEIRNKIDFYLQKILKLRNEETEMLNILYQQGDTISEPTLIFDETNRTIRWSGGLATVSSKQFALLKTLYNGHNHTANIDELEEAVWSIAGSMEKPFYDIHSLSMLVCRTRKKVILYDFPYKIECVKTISTQQLQGYRLVLNKITKKHYDN
jgi:DNA-binding response OmpR family regulator